MLNAVEYDMWLSTKDIAGKLKIHRDHVLFLVRHGILPQPIKSQTGYRDFHWHRDELELFLFKNAKLSLDNCNLNNKTILS